MMKIAGGLLLVLLFTTPAWSQESQTTYCHDPHVIADWNKRVTRSPDDIELQTLHALWLGLCLKVERQELTVDASIDIFDKARAAMVRDRQEKQQQQDQKDRSSATS